ncbi:TonB-dependent receptor, putative [Parvularcula bermudensis HTCC2503]|uniref:TonB-dependent receptor, putative n=2 Tax=Parvularcula TaxID=208215 RepID=E0TBE8_PARBH|nr:TonB-dependent receptor, putative [Parvularcula bermudensis HTCC2503]
MVALGVSAPAMAQDETEGTIAPVAEDTIVVTGARGKPRTVKESPVPIDVFDSEDLEDVSFTDANDILRNLVPSYSLSRQPISDGASFIRPASMRGLPTDKTLVLVNSKRRHRAALVSIGGSGTQGPDVATIPAIALENIEVLRDGAAAQYGSDAIAGVINFILKEDREGFKLTSQIGEFYAGDGEEWIVSANAGLPLGPDGFLNVSVEVSDAEKTDRSEQYCESWWCVEEQAAIDPVYAAGVESLFGGENVQPWGRPEAEALRTFFNAALPLGGGTELYSFGNYSESEATGNFFYRYPGNGVIEDVRLEDGSIYNPTEIYPGGFTPLFSGKVLDYSLVLGLKGESDKFAWDLSARNGQSEIQYSLANTLNPSMGPMSPTRFEPGNLINEETQIQADFSYLMEVGLASEMVFGFGLSYLEESYEIEEGEPASYETGPYVQSDPYDFCLEDMSGPTAAGAGIADLDCTDADDPVYRQVVDGSNGFPGYSPEFSGIYERDSYAVYLDLSTDITEKLFVQGAVRFEDYSDFDSELIYKVAARYALSDAVGIRGSFGTGFRAPTPGQQGTTNVSTRLPNGIPVATALSPPSSPLAQALGATPLEPETSTNYTAGVTATIGAFDVTLDFYRIELQDRVNAISTISIVDDCDEETGGIQTDCLGFRDNLIDAGAVGAETIDAAFYFTNAFDTITEGFDLVVTTDKDWGTYGSTDFTLSANYNETEFDGEVDELFNDESQYDFVNDEPNWRGVFTAKHEVGDISGLLRLNYWGPYDNSNGSTAPLTFQEFDPELFVDAELSLDVNDTTRFSVGARNLFDNYPDEGELGETCCGRIYRSDSVVDWQGGYYYAKATLTF